MRDFEDKVRRRTATLQVESGERSGALLKRGEQLLCTLVAYLLVVCNTELLGVGADGSLRDPRTHQVQGTERDAIEGECDSGGTAGGDAVVCWIGTLGNMISLHDAS